MALKPVVPKQYDESKLMAMVEPLSVRVEKLRNGHRMPIPLPASDESPDVPGGTNYDKAMIRELDSFLVTEWSGGGIYSIKVTDSQGASIDWISTYPVEQYPEQIPPPLRGVFNPLATSAPTRRTSPVAFPQLPPQWPQPQYPQQYQQPYYPPMPPPPPVGTPHYQLWSQEADKRSESAELRQLREENQRRDRESLELRHKAEIERERQANEQRFNKQDAALVDLRNMISTLATTLSNAATNANNKAPNVELEALKLQAQQTNDRLEREQRDRENERRERDSKDMLAQMQAGSQRQIDAMARQLEAFQASLAATNANKQDPMVEMLREQARQSADAIKEIARSHASSMERMQTSMLSPRDILALAKESTAATDQVTDKLTTTFGRVIDLQTKVTENALNLQPQGSPVVDMVREGFGNVKEMAERYFGRAELQARLEAAKQEQLVAAQRDLQLASMNMQAQQQGLSGVAPQPQIHANGTPTLPPIQPSKRKVKKAAAAEAAAEPSTKKRLGRTDAEWFGPIEPNVIQLRMGVDHFLESIKLSRVDAEGNPEGVAPQEAAMGIAQAASMVVHNQVNIPIMNDLLFPQRFGDFMDVLLPDVPEQYRADVISVLVPLLRGETGGGPGMTGEPQAEPPEPTDEDETDEDATDGDDDEKSDDNTDANPDDGNDAAQDGADSPPRGAKLVAVPAAVVPIKPVVANGRPINAPRRT